MRKLVKTFPGLPEGAGIYELSDGRTQFFNCGPGGKLPDPESLPDFEGFFQVTNVTTGEIAFVETDPFYKTLKNALMSAGSSIDNIKTEDQLIHTLSRKGYGEHISFYIRQKWQNRTPKTLDQAIAKAIFSNNDEQYQALIEKRNAREKIGLTRIK